MPLERKNTENDVRGAIALTKAQCESCYNVISKFDFADLFRTPRTLHISDDNVARLDLQGRTKEGVVNLQVQIGSFSVAAVLIAPDVCAIEDPQNQVGGRKGVISVLNKSLETTTIWTLGGTLP